VVLERTPPMQTTLIATQNGNANGRFRFNDNAL
jgi:hypothetical protein